MKKILFLIAASGTMLLADAQIKVPAASTAQTVKQDFGLGNIELSYSRPNMKGRKVFGDLVPYDKVWRTGANGATTLTFSDEVTIGNTRIAPGKYGLLSIPGKKEWTLIISKQTNVTSPSAYKQDMDVVRVVTPAKKSKQKNETFGIGFGNIKDNSCDVEISWENTMVSLPVTTNVDDRIMASIDKSMSSEKPAYAQAASYYMNTGKDLNKALGWYEKAVVAQPEAFWLQYQLASCYAKLGRTNEATTASKKSTELAQKAGNPDYVALNEKLMKELSKAKKR